MRIALFGLPKRTTHFLPVLVQENYKVVALFLSEPHEPYFPQIQAIAEAFKIPCIYPADAADPTLPGRLHQLEIDLLVSINFTKRLPKAILDAPRRAAINFHPSLLPKYRGPNPYFWVLRNGEPRTGVTAHFMEETLDTGPIILQKAMDIEAHETLGGLLGKLEALSEQVLLDTLRLFRSRDEVPAVPQDPAEATLAPQIKEDDLIVDFAKPTVEILRQIRACNPAYGAWSSLDGRAVKFFSASPVPGAVSLAPSGTCFLYEGHFLIATGDGAIRPEVILLEDGGFYSADSLAMLGLLVPGSRFGA